MTRRVCACGCGRRLQGARPDQRFASDACRARACRQRRGITPGTGPASTDHRFWTLVRAITRRHRLWTTNHRQESPA